MVRDSRKINKKSSYLIDLLMLKHCVLLATLTYLNKTANLFKIAKKPISRRHFELKIHNLQRYFKGLTQRQLKLQK